MNNFDPYEITILGEINKKRFSSYEIIRITYIEGNTQIFGYFDQSSLFSILKTIRDLCLKILKLELIKTNWSEQK